MNKRWFQALLAVSVVFFTASYVSAHCEIPCGIYDDEMRINMIAEHITTIEKSMKEIMNLGAQNPINYNQLIRWVSNKEDHANEIQEIVSQYFMTQRIKPDTKNYSQKLALLNKILVYSMNCKQTTDLSHITMLRSLLKEFQTLYFEQK
jgi:nickel superoxide dismutase